MTFEAENGLPEGLEHDVPEAVKHDIPRLAVGSTVIVAYNFVLSNPGRFLLLTIAPLSGLYSAELWSLAQPTLTETAETAVFLVKLAFVSVFSLSWHRLMLVGSVTSGINPLRLIFRGLRFYGYCILMVLFRQAFLFGAGWVLAFGTVAVVIAHGLAPIRPLLRRALRTPTGALFALFLIACGASYHANPSKETAEFIERALTVIMLVPLARVLLALPAVAMGERGDLIAGAWQHSRGNDVQLCLGLALCVGPFESARWAMPPALDMLHLGDWGTPVAVLLRALLLLLEVALGTSFLCASYRRLAGAGGTL
jgi:hypothetical protein